MSNREFSRLTYDDRLEIEKGLKEQESFRTIAERIGKSPTTISREVRKYFVINENYGYGRIPNRCVHRFDCEKQFLCPGMQYLCKKNRCSRCRKESCNARCNEYEEDHCLKLLKPPYVCNGCESKNKCPLVKKIYSAKEANIKAEKIRVESRRGMSLTDEEIKEFDEQVSPRMKSGQSLHHIYATSPDQFSICEKTAYKLIHNGLISASPFDCPRMLRMRPRKAKSTEHKVDHECRKNRTYQDFLAYMKEHPDESVLEGDSVIGAKGGKCILTLTWPDNFQIGFLRDHNNSATVIEIFDRLYHSIGAEKFLRVFPSVLLVDNGSEFSNPKEIEKFGIKVFYCDPNAPYQKGSCENTHELLRRICPKGTSFNNLDQGFFDLAYSHINSMARKKLNDHCPYDLFSLLFASGINVESIFGIKKIQPEAVNLTPNLLNRYLKEKGLK